ncbi:hypothetical protein [Lactococcus allomyrinae]|uniref:hypothetical protein n=1 Tax=Lactococcus allomyrinae TaxID=2419773 RepID=UPI001969473D|nr:hypothetical protein [Lactococcus allomyrinae]
MTEVTMDYQYLEQQRNAWERLEKNLKRALSLPWEEFDSPDSGKIPKELDKVHVLHHDVYEYPILASKNIEIENARMKRPSLYLNNGLIALGIGYGVLGSKKIKGTSEEQKEVTISEENAPVLSVPSSIICMELLPLKRDNSLQPTPTN